MESGEYNEAEQYLKDFADNPEYTPALIECYTKLQKYDQALKSSADLLEKQQEYSPQWWSTKFQQFSLYLLQKEYRKIIDEITKLLAKNSLTPEMKERLEKAKDEAQNALTPPAPVNNQPPNPK